MTDAPLVSCIIIFLNGEKFIAEAIESVLAQTYTNWELIFVDDGTTDGASEIAKSYVAAHPERIFYTTHENGENRGMSASRNVGIEMAKGEFIALLDADDLWLPERLERHVATLVQHPEAAMSVANTVLWSSWNKDELPKWCPWLSADILSETGLPSERLLAPPLVARAFLENHGAGIPSTSTFTFRKEKLMAVGSYENSFRTLYEDQVALFKIFLNFPIVALDDVQSYYRQHPESACAQTGRMSGDKLARPRFLEWLQSYMIGLGVTDADLWRALRGEFSKYDNPKGYRLSNFGNSFVDTWNEQSRLAVVWLLTPKYYRKIKRMLGSESTFLFSYIDVQASENHDTQSS